MSMAANAEPARNWRRLPNLNLEPALWPAVFLLTAVLILAPVGYLIYGSFRTDSPGAPDAVFTLANWAEVYGSTKYWSAFFNTVVLSTVVAVLSMLLGGAMAWIVARTDAPGRDWIALLIIIPLMISNLITTLAWIALAAPNAGFINAASRALIGVPTIFDIYSFPGIVLILTTDHAAFAFIAFYAALRSIDGTLEEASFMLGAGPVQTSVRMTLPLIWPAIASTFLLIFVMTAENFSVPTLLGANFGYQTLTSLIFNDMTVVPSRPTIAATAGTMLLWIGLLGTVWQRRVLRKAANYVTISGKGSRPRRTSLGPMRYLATAFLLLYVFVSVVLPYVALLVSSFMGFLTPRITWKLFTLDNYAALLGGGGSLPIVNSLLYSIGGGALLVGLYVVISYLIKRGSPFSARIMEYLAIIPTSIPAIVLAVGVLWTFVVLPLPIYGTAAILIIAYFVRYIGLGVRQARTALAQVSDDLSEAARMCGATSARAFRDVDIPLVAPAALALWTILFMSIFTEISLTILLYNYDTITLPVKLWNNIASGHLTRAFAIAVLQGTVIFVVIFLANRKFGILRNTLSQ
jgi:iron(III) transport system permease protein